LKRLTAPPPSVSIHDLSEPPATIHRVPRISSFYGIAIMMYWRERDHPISHFHAEQGHRA